MAKKKTPKKVLKPKSSARVQKRTKAAFYTAKAIGDDFCGAIRRLEKLTRKRAVLIWHGEGEYASMDGNNYVLFSKRIGEIEKKKCLVVINSPGGEARPAFKLASLLQKHCGGYTLAVPYYSKSAATLFALGAEKIILSRFAELGPLDVQVYDEEKEKTYSALEVVQAIERLNSEALNAVDQQMFYWMRRAHKKTDTLLPISTHFVSEMMRPLFEKIDSVNFTAMARSLKVAQDYAERLLMRSGFPGVEAKRVADILTNYYADHGFVLDFEELNRIGLTTAEEATAEIGEILEELAFLEPENTLLGPLVEV